MSEDEVTYKVFRDWLAGTTPTEQEWEAVIEEDEGHNYSSPNGGPINSGSTVPSIGTEVLINTSGASDRHEETTSDEEGA